MKKRLSKLTIITTVLTLLPMLLGAALYDKLPDTVVTHWGFNNEPTRDGTLYCGKKTGEESYTGTTC